MLVPECWADQTKADFTLVVDIASKIQAAEGFVELGMYQDAFNALEDLPPEQRAHPDVLAMRVRIYLAANRPDDACVVAEGMTSKAPQFAASWLSLARVQCASGDRPGAKESLQTAFEIAPECRLDVLDDPDISLVW